MAFAGRRIGLAGVLVCLNLARMFSMWVRISGRTGTCCRLLDISCAKKERFEMFAPIVRHIQNVLLRSDGDFFENLLTGMFADVVADHYPMSLFHVNIHNSQEPERLTSG
jgi:hypothetical protein